MIAAEWWAGEDGVGVGRPGGEPRPSFADEDGANAATNGHRPDFSDGSEEEEHGPPLRPRDEDQGVSSSRSLFSTPVSSVTSLSSSHGLDRWPAPPDPAAFHGLPGDIARTIDPHSEADLVAILAQTLAVAGNAIGRGPHFVVEADEHHPNLNVCLVGPTSKGRKGSSYGHIERFGTSADPTWGDRIESGLTSGEGLIWALRDSTEREGETDEGVHDKRLFVFEPEFANVLRVLERQGNRLSSVVRDAWDGRVLRTLTRTTSAKATGAHVSIVGHITADELRRYLDRTEIANGFGNRFLWLCVKRSKQLPEGGQMHTVDVQPLITRLREAIRFAGTIRRVERDPAAKALWHDVYGDLSAGLPGLVGALTGRAEAQVMRLAHVYALLDLSDTIRLPHLQAALALWDYSLRSVQHVFGNSLGDPVADTILELLQRSRPEPVSRTDIRASVGGRVGASQIERALALLHSHGLAHMRQRATGGRPVEEWLLGRERSEQSEERAGT